MEASAKMATSERERIRTLVAQLKEESQAIHIVSAAFDIPLSMTMISGTDGVASSAVSTGVADVTGVTDVPPSTNVIDASSSSSSSPSSSSGMRAIEDASNESLSNERLSNDRGGRTDRVTFQEDSLLSLSFLPPTYSAMLEETAELARDKEGTTDHARKAKMLAQRQRQQLMVLQESATKESARLQDLAGNLDEEILKVRGRRAVAAVEIVRVEHSIREVRERDSATVSYWFCQCGCHCFGGCGCLYSFVYLLINTHTHSLVYEHTNISDTFPRGFIDSYGTRTSGSISRDRR